MFEGQPKGLFALALANTGERFGYYTMLAVFVLFLQENFGWSAGVAGTYYSTFLMFVYFLPFIGGLLADKFGYGKMVKIGITIMFLGYVLLAVPLGNGSVAVSAIIGALTLISIGTGLFKGNLQVMVGDLYSSPEMAGKRDSAFSLFYMAINIGALFAPTAAVEIMKYAQTLGFNKADSYHFAFGVACISLIISILIYFVTRNTFKHVEGGHTAAPAKAESASAASQEVELSKEDTKARIVALCLVFAVVIFFWMAFHQNGLTLTYFAAEFTQQSSSGLPSMLFDVTNLVMVIIAIYSSFAVLQSKTQKGRIIATCITLLCAAGIIWKGFNVGDHVVAVSAPIFQQFNPSFVVGLTPVSVALFGWLAARKKEPTAPRKIAYGMIVAAIGFGIMIFGSTGITPLEKKVTEKFNIDEQLKAEKKHNETDFKAFVVKVEADFNSQKEKLESEAQQLQKQEDKRTQELLKNATDKQQKSGIQLDANLAKIHRDALTASAVQEMRSKADQQIKAYEVEMTKKNLNAETETKVKKAQVEAQIEASGMRVSPNWLILTYLVLTFAELLLSPMGISFVSKVAPPKYKGMMMGGWFVATAIGNFLTVIPALLWCKVPLVVVWGVLAALCLLSFIFIFSQMKRLEKVS
jgi:hypothetical protein